MTKITEQRRVKIVSDGTLYGTTIRDTETDEPILSRSVKYEFDVTKDDIAHCEVVALAPELKFEGAAEVTFDRFQNHTEMPITNVWEYHVLFSHTDPNESVGDGWEGATLHVPKPLWDAMGKPSKVKFTIHPVKEEEKSGLGEAAAAEEGRDDAGHVDAGAEDIEHNS